MQVEDNVFVVTGGGNGIGKAVVLALLQRGATVAAADLDEVALARLAADAGAGERLSIHRLDVADADAVNRLPAAVVERHGQVDGLFNIAGIAQHFEKAAGIAEDRMKQILDVNFYGTVAMTRAFLPLLEQRDAGVVVITSSLAAMVPVPGAALYGASKAAVAQFGYGLAQDLRNAKSRVTVTTVSPGTVWTDLVRQSSQTLGAPEALARAFAMPAEKAADKIVDAALGGRMSVVIGKDAKFYAAVGRVSTRLAERLSYLQVARMVYRERE
ncbi:SDR family NAD(P)-dependent oxidoreductase [Gordonia crocea]|uniref:Short-chain dehydrogenase n=1 Tax=Gordonia crocea TaxID=589162 RepID=A0A7I9UXG2_9ACTN|nr:SDR family oxidoreductase [Gordonia crocea]GED97765.1 short-chain dehydrogenase [Gordonia crocea]